VFLNMEEQGGRARGPRASARARGVAGGVLRGTHSNIWCLMILFFSRGYGAFKMI
jgi:hypothetical protein